MEAQERQRREAPKEDGIDRYGGRSRRVLIGTAVACHRLISSPSFQSGLDCALRKAGALRDPGGLAGLIEGGVGAPAAEGLQDPPRARKWLILLSLRAEEPVKIEGRSTQVRGGAGNEAVSSSLRHRKLPRPNRHYKRSQWALHTRINP